jgi:propanol-preferring alcohol dehydrogenase
MQAMLLDAQGQPLRLAEVPRPRPGPIRSCSRCAPAASAAPICTSWTAICMHPRLPLVLGHEIVGSRGRERRQVERFALGQRVGVPWLGRTCGHCRYCTGGSENLCDAAEFTGYTLDGGYAEFALADQRYCFALPANTRTPKRRRCSAPD